MRASWSSVRMKTTLCFLPASWEAERAVHSSIHKPIANEERYMMEILKSLPLDSSSLWMRASFSYTIEHVAQIIRAMGLAMPWNGDALDEKSGRAGSSAANFVTEGLMSEFVF